jgi:hypothetical protein
LIDSYRLRPDLALERWLKTQELLVYLGLSGDDLLRQIASGEIKVKSQQDGKLTFGVRLASQYDDCCLANGGGTCLYFEAHRGRTISCLNDLGHLDAEHPNMENLPSEEDARDLEGKIARVIEPAQSLH